MRYSLLLTCLAMSLCAQTPTPNKAIVVEHAVPFGTVTGKLLMLGNSLVFYDDQQPESSLVIARSAVQSLTVEGPTITVQTRDTVRSRSGEIRQLSFRVSAGGDAAPATTWFSATAPGADTPALAPKSSTAKAAAKANEPTSYQVVQDKRIGSTEGRLLVGEDMVSYESISDVKASRRWEYRSLKEIRLPNPYQLEVRPFEGDAYKFKLEGSGMDPAAFKQLVDRVTAARGNR